MKGVRKMTFKGFNVAYPEYEVITPQTKQSYTVRSLNVAEEERLKGSLMTPSKIADHLNKCLFESIVKRPENITDFNDFLKAITVKDRDALIFGLYHITYDEIRNYEISCSSCSVSYPVTVKASSTFNFNEYPGKDILTDRLEVPLPVTKGVIAVIKQPTILDEILSLKELGSRPGSTMEIITETLVVEQFKQDVENDKRPIIYNSKPDVLDAYLSLPAGDKRAIYQAYDEKFGQYSISLKMKSYCTSCGAEDDYDIDLVDNFFRALYSA